MADGCLLFCWPAAQRGVAGRMRRWIGPWRWAQLARAVSLARGPDLARRLSIARAVSPARSPDLSGAIIWLAIRFTRGRVPGHADR